MAIQGGIATGKARKSAGLYTFYNRLGVSMFRGKPVRSPGYKSSVPQRMQQSVFRFMKANVDASGVKAFVETFYDAKPRRGKSETKFNMFYRAFLPHMVAAKPLIYELPVDDLIVPNLFLGAPDTNNDKLTNGQLGTLTIVSGGAQSMVVDQTILDQIIAKANTLISTKDVPYTTENIFIGLFGGSTTSNTGYMMVQPTKIKPTLADGVYTFDLSALTTGMNMNQCAYAAILIAGVDTTGGVDITRRKFATDSVMLNAETTPTTPLSVLEVNKVSATAWNMKVSKEAANAAGLPISEGAQWFVRQAGSEQSYGSVQSITDSGENVVLNFTTPGSPQLQIDTIAIVASPVIHALDTDMDEEISMDIAFTNGIQINSL